MKYKTLAVAAATIFTAMTADANAGWCDCDSTFNGKATCGKDYQYQTLNPNYWACRALFGTINTLCKGVCLKTEAQSAKLKQNEQACAKNGNEAACQKELETDVTTAISGMGPDLKDAEGNLAKMQADLKAEADREAVCYEKTGEACPAQ